jgi:4-hydroxy-2-oxoheptanedioate aldolase
LSAKGVFLKKYGLKKAIRQGNILYGIGLGTAASSFVEIIGYSGFDYVFIDMEHTTIELESLSKLVMASEVAGVFPIVRVSENDPVQIRKVIELGAEGIIIPHISTEKDAEKAVQATRFPPEGVRGFASLVRSHMFDLPRGDLPDYLKMSNEEIVVIPLIEDREAVDNIDEILNIKGVDAIFLGPADLSVSIGLPGQYDNEIIKTCLRKTMKAATSRGIPVMSEISYLARPASVENIRTLVENGLRLIMFGTVEGAVRAHCLNVMGNIVNKI